MFEDFGHCRSGGQVAIQHFTNEIDRVLAHDKGDPQIAVHNLIDLSD
jgi:hypothetical protein